MLIKVAHIGTVGEEYEVGEGTVAEVLSEAGIDLNGYDVYMNGELATSATPVTDGAVITLAPRIKAGN